MASGNINIETILRKYGERFGNLYQNKPEFKAAIKEIVEAVIDKCAEEGKVGYGTFFFKDKEKATWIADTYIDKESILNIKKEIKYE